MEKNNWIFLGVGILIGVLIMVLLGEHAYNGAADPFKKPDTTYNVVKLDSITIHMKTRDTIIYNLKIKSKEDVEKVYALDDSSTVELFRKLATSTDKGK